MARDAHTGLHAGFFLHGLCNAVGGGGAKACLGAFCHPFLALHAGFLAVDGTLGHSDDGEVGTLLCAAFHGRTHTVDIIGLFRQQDNICTACNAGVQRQPASLVAHDLNAHHAAVAACGGVDAVDHIGGNVHGGVEAEGYVGTIDIVINGLGQADDVQTLLREQVCGFVGAIAAQAQQAVQLGFLVGLFHGGNFINVVVLHHTHHFKGGALGAQNGAAQRQDAAEIVLAHLLVVAVDQATVSVQDANDLHVIAHAGIQCFCYAADGGVQTRTVAAGGQDSNTFFHSKALFHLVFSAARSAFQSQSARRPTCL